METLDKYDDFRQLSKAQRLNAVRVRMIAEYGKARMEIKRQMKAFWETMGDDVSMKAARRYQRLTRLFDTVTEKAGIHFLEVDKIARLSLPVEYNTEFLTQAWMYEMNAGMNLPWGGVNEAQVRQAITSDLSKLANSPLMQKDKRRQLQRIRSGITQTIIQGKPYSAAVKDIDYILGFRDRTGKIIAGKAGEIYKSNRILRTEAGRVHGKAEVDNMAKARELGIDTLLQLISTLDNRTRKQSGDMDKQLSNEEGKFKYPNGNYYHRGSTGHGKWDINDRETTVPVVKGYSPELRRARDLATKKGELIPNQPFKKWAEDRRYSVNKFGQKVFELPPIPLNRKAMAKKYSFNTYGDIKNLLNDLDTAYPDLFRNGPFRDLVIDNGDYLMATDCRGTVFVSNSSGNSYRVGQTLKTALRKISRNEKLGFKEEYSIESLWHEIWHNRSMGYCPISRMTHENLAMMETINQFTARHTYDWFLKKLGGKARHKKQILDSGYGYKHYLENFRYLFKAWNIDEMSFFKSSSKVLLSDQPWSGYIKVFSSLLKKETGFKVTDIRQVLNVLDSSTYSFKIIADLTMKLYRSS